MSKYGGPRLRLVRKLGELPALTTKTSNKQSTPGQHGKPKSKFLKKTSAYGLRLLEKQKLRFNYNINERQFVSYVEKAKKSNGPTGENLLILLEMRLDNIVYRLGFAPTIRAARQLVNHGHILVNQKKLDIPSYACQLKDVIAVKQNNKSRALVESFSSENLSIPDHLSCNKKGLSGIVNTFVNRNEVSIDINELLVVEYYSRN